MGVLTCFGGRPIRYLCSLTIATAALLLQILQGTEPLLITCDGHYQAGCGDSEVKHNGRLLIATNSKSLVGVQAAMGPLNTLLQYMFKVDMTDVKLEHVRQQSVQWAHTAASGVGFMVALGTACRLLGTAVNDAGCRRAGYSKDSLALLR